MLIYAHTLFQFLYALVSKSEKSRNLKNGWKTFYDCIKKNEKKPKKSSEEPCEYDCCCLYKNQLHVESFSYSLQFYSFFLTTFFGFFSIGVRDCIPYTVLTTFPSSCIYLFMFKHFFSQFSYTLTITVYLGSEAPIQLFKNRSQNDPFP